MRKYVFILITLLIFAALTSQAVSAQAGQGGKVYYVTWGDSLNSIATQHGVTIEAIMRQNGINNPDFIYVGQALVIPTTGYNHNSGNWSQSCSYYTVRAGDTLSGIAWAHNTTVPNLLQLNSLYNKDFVYVGQQLCVPGGGSNHTPTHHSPNYNHNHQPQQQPASYHIVSPGETITSIAARYGVNHWDIVQINNLSNASYIWVGQKLLIPGHHHTNVTKKHHHHPHEHKPTATPDPDDDDDDDDKKPKDRYKELNLRLGLNVSYTYWGRPVYGLDDCVANQFDDGSPVKRLTVEVLATNNTEHELPGAWGDTKNVIFHTLSGARRYACVHYQNHYGTSGSGPEVNLPNLGGPYPRSLEPGDTMDVTYYTHIEKTDLVTKVEFKFLGICFDPNSGDRISCE